MLVLAMLLGSPGAVVLPGADVLPG
jgi:hypothetical protein